MTDEAGEGGAPKFRPEDKDARTEMLREITEYDHHPPWWEDDSASLLDYIDEMEVQRRNIGTALIGLWRALNNAEEVDLKVTVVVPVEMRNILNSVFKETMGS